MTLESSGHDQELLAQVRPEDWTNPQPQGRYNLVVLGGGTAGLVCAMGAAGLGARVALVEKRALGGDCLNLGCVPSKALLRSARAVGEIMRAGELGVRVHGYTVDFPAVMERMRRLRAGIAAHDSAQRLADAGVDVFLGAGRFTGPETLEVAGARLEFHKAVIATGSTPGGLPFPGLDEAGYLTNETVFDLETLPASLGVLGTGPIGCELAQAMARFGSRVIMVGRSGRIMTKEDPEAADLVARALEADGVDLALSTTVDKVELSPEGSKVLHLDTGGNSRAVEVAQILVGAGRKPTVRGLGLEEAGVEYDTRAGIQVDEHLRTSNKYIFACGDCCLPRKFTHVADATARMVIQNALFAGRAKLGDLNIPWCTYTDPEVAHVGLYPREIKEKGEAVQTFRVDMAEVDRAITDGDAGFLKVHVKEGDDRILGATLVAAHAGETISQISAAMAGGLGLKGLSGVIHPYPTQAEAVKRAADAYNRTRLTPGVKKWMERWFQWRR